MIRLKIKVVSTDGDKFERLEELPDNYIISRQNPEFIKLIEKAMELSHIEEVDCVRVIANFGEI